MRSAKPDLLDGLCVALAPCLGPRRIGIDSAPARGKEPRSLFVERDRVADALDADVVTQMRKTAWPDAAVGLDGVPDAEEVHARRAHPLSLLELFDRPRVWPVRLVQPVGPPER